jgi:Sap, sulfolipid-1-addressing protein
VLKLVLGALLLGLALRTWRQRPRGGEEPPIPEWMRAIDRVTPGRAAMLGLALAAINPKSLLLTVAAAAGIAQTGIDAGEQALVLGLFALIGTVGLALPMVISFRLGDRAAESLAALRHWMVANNAAIIAVIFLLIAAKLIGDGISGLSA